MKQITVLVFGLFLSLSSQAEPPLTSTEDQYLRARERSIHKATEQDDGPAIKILEAQLRTIIGPIKVDGFPEQGQINLETLISGEGGSDQVDGLMFRAKSATLFVTTEKLLNYYVRRHSKYPKDLNELTRTGNISNGANFYSAVFDWDAAVTNFVEIPVNRSKNQSFARAYMGVFSQDVGPIIPDRIFVVVAKGSRILLVSSAIKTEVAPIQPCKEKWGSFAKKHDDALVTYRASDLKNEKAFDDATKYENEGWAAYQGCFGREAVNQVFFAPLTIQAQSIVDRL